MNEETSVPDCVSPQAPNQTRKTEANFKNNPIPFSWQRELPHWIVLTAMFATAAIVWTHVGDRIPVHWNAAGEVDGHGSKAGGLLMIPFITLQTYLVLLWIPRIDPGKTNYRSFSEAYASVRLTLSLFMGLIYAGVILTALGKPVAMNTLISFGTGGLLIVIGNVLSKVRPNWFFGIRTPWTLSSKLSWDKTHRIGGWQMVASGLAFIASAIIGTKISLFIAIGFTLISTVAIVVYSYRVYLIDPNRIAPADTLPHADSHEGSS